MSQSSRRPLLILVALALVAIFAASAIGKSMPLRTYSTNLVMSKKFPAFHGSVRSSNEFCTQHRQVKLYSAVQGPDKLLGTTHSDKNGKWKIRVGPPSGVFYSFTPAYGSASLGIKCKSDTSGSAVVD